MTDSISFVRASFDDVVDQFDTWRFPSKFHTMSIRTSPGSFEENLIGLQPLLGEPDYLLMATVPDEWTAILTNRAILQEQELLSHRIGLTLKKDTVDVSLIWPSPKSGIRNFTDFGAWLQYNKNAGSLPIEHRYVSVFQSDLGLKWNRPYLVEQSLTPFPWAPAARPDADPFEVFNPDLLVDYCHQMGIDVFNEGFYADRAARVTDDNLLEKIKQVASNSTYEAAQKYAGIDSLVLP
ncbi:hypothetical protein [Trueperella bialowiezensis]|uniref:hypothetical protein n=1 Tax=Trueperella bialowiezensis TaxID=312285 RepID=UPI000F82B1E6|nr:hypothetical protein [Trueperella bialowiezensis]